MLPVHIFGYPADMPGARAHGARARALDGGGRLRGARRRACRRDAGRRSRQPLRLRLLPEQADDHGGGRSGDLRPAPRPRSGSTPSATRAALRTWAGSTTTGSASTTASTTSRAPSASAQLERLDDLLAERARVAELYGEALAGVEGLELPCPDADGDRRSWFVYVVQLPHGVDRDAAVLALRARGVDSKPYLPGHPPLQLLPRALRSPRGRVPGLRGRGAPLACAAVLPGLTDSEVERVVDAVRAVATEASPPTDKREMSPRSAKDARTPASGASWASPGAAGHAVALWHRAIGQMADDFHLELGYLLTGWIRLRADRARPLLLVPRWSCRWACHPESRLYPRSRNALFLGWGTSLYMLGAALASIVGSAVGT